MNHPLIPSQSSKPVNSKPKELVVPIRVPTAAALVLETLAVVLSLVAAPLLAVVVLSLSAYKSSVGFMRTTLQLW